MKNFTLIFFAILILTLTDIRIGETSPTKGDCLEKYLILENGKCVDFTFPGPNGSEVNYADFMNALDCASAMADVDQSVENTISYRKHGGQNIEFIKKLTMKNIRARERYFETCAKLSEPDEVGLQLMKEHLHNAKEVVRLLEGLQRDGFQVVP